MAVKRKGTQTVHIDSLVEQPEAELALAAPYQTPPAEEDASLCPECGEPLVWHEEACVVVPSSYAQEPEEVVLPVWPELDAGLAPVPFAYTLGQPVQPAPGVRPHKIVWRGQVKERQASTGLVRRVNVYRLDNGYWDCYYETDLRAA